MSPSVPVHVLRGSDEVLLGREVTRLVDRLVGDDDRGLLLDEFEGAEYDLGAAVDAAQTPPLFTDRRIVVMRNAGRFSKAADVAPLVHYLEAPLDTSTVVVVWEIAPGQQRLSAIPKKLQDAVTAAGGAITVTDPGSSRSGKDDWWAEQLAASSVTFDRDAAARLRDHLGDDLGALVGILARVEATHDGGTVGVAELEPLLGDAGSVPPWELTDALDQGDVSRALDRLHRMLGSGDRHPLQIMATLQSHYLRIARLDGSGVRGDKDAADLLGIRGSTFPAKKALNASRALGSTGTKRAVALLAEADLTLRGGGVAWPGDLVLEVLVARLARLAGSGRRRR